MRTLAIVGYGFVGRAIAAGFADCAQLRFHDPAVPGSVPLVDLVQADLVFVCVPTPTRDGACDLSAVEQVLADLAGLACRAPVVLKSTVPPGTTDRLAREHRALRLLCSPEFLRERSSVADFAATPRVILGWPDGRDDPEAHALVHTVFAERFDVPIVDHRATEAELVKVVANALFAVKVSFANELAEFAEAIGVRWNDLRDTLALDPRIVDDHLAVPGPDGERGFGGRCLPKDGRALLHEAAAQGLDLPVVRAALEANRIRRPDAEG